MRPGARTGDSGTKSAVATVAKMTATRGSQNSQWYERWSTITPASTMPAPAPMPRIADIRPMPPATRSRGNSSRMIPKARGKMPPPAPWTTRPATSSGIEVATADISVPTPRRTRTPTSTRSLPWMSPRRPSSGVATEALSR
jgi:hypothetical protein